MDVYEIEKVYKLLSTLPPSLYCIQLSTKFQYILYKLYVCIQVCMFVIKVL